MKYLLDVSTIVALLWKSHTQNAVAEHWVKGKALAVCPITELGFLRVVTSTAYNASMENAREVLKDWLDNSQAEFVPADIRAMDGSAAPASGKTTDWYLANLAKAKGMKWATLDTRANHPAAEIVS